MIKKALLIDIPNLEILANRAYRGEPSTLGWTTEKHLIAGNVRTDKEDLESKINNPNACILVYEEDEAIIGMVYVEKREASMYLGMLCVEPTLQSKGVGKKLMQAATQQAIHWHCTSIEMIVLPMRTELIAWYNKQGYIDIGKNIPFEVPQKFAQPLQPLHFITLQKTLA
jgi:ribosomal protein S18 acetylase RimI-like enzyme